MAKAPRSLAGNVVAITGGARGIGRATAAALIAHGARVAIGDVDSALAQRTAQELGGGTIGLPLDVTERDSFDSFLQQVETELGPLDVLINNAGIKPVEPEDVADAIVEALQTGRVDVYVPKSVVGIVRLNALMPRKAMEWVGKMLKGDQVLANPDHQARAAYEARMVETIVPLEAEVSGARD